MMKLRPLHMKLLGAFLLALFPYGLSYAQHVLRGRVVDSATAQPLPFVNILYGGTGQGMSTNIDGQFEIVTAYPVGEITTSYVGYAPERVAIDKEKYNLPLTVKLKAIAYTIDEVVVKPGINPAHRIIDSVYANRSKNNPENLESFSYRNYNKMVFSYRFDSVFYRTLLPRSMPGDVIRRTIAERQSRFDSVMRDAPSIIMETVSERSYKKPGRNSEEVLATRMTGYSEPYAVLLATQMQSFSFYPERFTLLQKTFLSPVSRNAVSNYLFVLEEQYLTESLDTVFVVSFRPRRKSSFTGLKGTLYVNSNGYAIQNVLAQPDQPLDLLFDASIEQRYQRVGGIQWFPSELNMVLRLYPSRAGLVAPSRSKLPQYLVGSGRSYLTGIRINPNIDSVKFSHVELTMHPDMFKRSDDFWKVYRTDSLTGTELRSYRLLDSLGRVYNLDRFSRILASAATGKIDLGYVAIDINRLMAYNLFEGYRLGVGLETGSKISRNIAIGGFFAYGFNDEREKYGAHARVRFHETGQVEASAHYQSDVSEPGSMSFSGPRLLAAPHFIGTIFNNRRDYVEQYGGAFGFRLLQKYHASIYFNRNEYTVGSGFAYIPSAGDTLQRFNTTEAGIRFRIVWNERFARSVWGIVPISTGNPAMWINLSRGIDALGATLEYSRLEFRYRQQFDSPKYGTTQLVLTGGMVQGNVPVSLLYFARGARLARFFDGPESFSTMPPNTFIANRFASIFLSHQFLPLVKKFQGKKFNPRLVLVQRFVIGNYNPAAQHGEARNVLLPLSRGYWEPGVQVADILRTPFATYGIGCSYGVSHYSHRKWQENLAITINLRLLFQ